MLPGGLVDPDETARDCARDPDETARDCARDPDETREACARETEEEVGLDVEATRFVGPDDDDPERDPRGNVSAGYRCVPTDDVR